MSIKTYKRETAWILLLVVYLLTIYTVYSGSDLTRVKILDIITVPTIMFALSAFGLDWLGKSGKGIFSKEEDPVVDKTEENEEEIK